MVSINHQQLILFFLVALKVNLPSTDHGTLKKVAMIHNIRKGSLADEF